ncbi:MAG: methylmalonyl-CoA mutase family protein [Parvibaculaceae bacterium]
MSDAAASSTLPLAADFPPATEDDWRKRVEAVLKGADFEKRLYSRTADGIAVAPLYSSGAACAARRPEQTPWIVMQRADHPDPGAANAQALDDLTHGATGLHLVFAGAPGAFGFGLPAPDRKGMGRLLGGIRIDAIDLRLDAGPHGAAAAERLAQWVATQPVDPERLRLAFGIDPIGSGGAQDRIDPDFAPALRASVQSLRDRHFTGPFALASGAVWHNAGASEAQELALMIATGVAYLRALDHLDDAHLKRAVALSVAADQDMFLTLAKFRAARLLWSRVLTASGLAADAVTLDGETSWRMMAALDAHTNILRTTAAVFGAALGGADRITVLPFSLAQGLPDEFARRIARNTQTILQEESQLWRVGDPASGSGFIEHLTRALCDKAWTLFQDIERHGGITAFVNDGHAATLVAANRRQELARIRDKAGTIIGVTAYRPPREAEPSIVDLPRETAPSPRLAEVFETAGASP